MFEGPIGLGGETNQITEGDVATVTTSQGAQGMFAQARASGVDLIVLGAELKARKEELTARAAEGGLPPARPTVVTAALV